MRRLEPEAVPHDPAGRGAQQAAVRADALHPPVGEHDVGAALDLVEHLRQRAEVAGRVGLERDDQAHRGRRTASADVEACRGTPRRGPGSPRAGRARPAAGRRRPRRARASSSAEPSSTMKMREPAPSRSLVCARSAKSVRQVLLLVERRDDEEELWPAFGLSPLARRSRCHLHGAHVRRSPTVEVGRAPVGRSLGGAQRGFQARAAIPVGVGAASPSGGCHV